MVFIYSSTAISIPVGNAYLQRVEEIVTKAIKSIDLGDIFVTGKITNVD